MVKCSHRSVADQLVFNQQIRVRLPLRAYQFKEDTILMVLVEKSSKFGSLAQLVEQESFKLEVEGSIPSGSIFINVSTIFEE